MKFLKNKRFEAGISLKNALIFFCGKHMVNTFLIL